jgi:hypothetical protein
MAPYLRGVVRLRFQSNRGRVDRRRAEGPTHLSVGRGRRRGSGERERGGGTVRRTGSPTLRTGRPGSVATEEPNRSGAGRRILLERAPFTGATARFRPGCVRRRSGAWSVARTMGRWSRKLDVGRRVPGARSGAGSTGSEGLVGPVGARAVVVRGPRGRRRELDVPSWAEFRDVLARPVRGSRGGRCFGTTPPRSPAPLHRGDVIAPIPSRPSHRAQVTAPKSPRPSHREVRRAERAAQRGECESAAAEARGSPDDQASVACPPIHSVGECGRAGPGTVRHNGASPTTARARAPTSWVGARARSMSWPAEAGRRCQPS